MHPLAGYGTGLTAHDFYGGNGMGGPGDFMTPTSVHAGGKMHDPYSNVPVCSPPDVPGSPNDPKPAVTLENDDLWTPFHKVGTEMVITKNGR